MSLIRKHGAVLQAWACLALVFTGTLCGQFAMQSLLNIPPRVSSVATLPCEI